MAAVQYQSRGGFTHGAYASSDGIRSAGSTKEEGARVCTVLHTGYYMECQYATLKSRAFLFHGQVDTVVWCTGYNYSFPFLEGSGLLTTPVSQRVHPLYEQLFHVRYPSLSFIGLPQR